MLWPSAVRARRSSALLRIASTPTRSAGSTMSEKPKRSFRWKVTEGRYDGRTERRKDQGRNGPCFPYPGVSSGDARAALGPGGQGVSGREDRWDRPAMVG